MITEIEFLKAMVKDLEGHLKVIETRIKRISKENDSG